MKVHLDVERKQERRDFDGAGDDADEVRRRRQRLDLEPEINQTKNGQQDRQAEPQSVQQTPGNIPIFALPDQLPLEGAEDEEGRRRDVDESGLLEANSELRVVGEPGQVRVPQRVGTKRLVDHFKKNFLHTNFFSIFPKKLDEIFSKRQMNQFLSWKRFG